MAKRKLKKFDPDAFTKLLKVGLVACAAAAYTETTGRVPNFECDHDFEKSLIGGPACRKCGWTP